MSLDSKNHFGWFRKADEDELNAKSILKHRDGTPGMICFLSQQMAEKYLKGLLVYCNKPFRKVHDLIELETLLMEYYPNIVDFHDEFGLLNRFYIMTRYPADYPEFSWEMAEEAYAAAERIKQFVLEKIG